MEFKAAIFDFDGTIADSMPMWGDFASNFVRFMKKVPQEGLNKVVNAMSVAEAEVYLHKQYFSELDFDKLHNNMYDFVLERYKKGFDEKAGASQFIKALYDRGVVMGIATATDRGPVSLALESLGLSKYFKCLVTCTDVGIGKNSSAAVFDRAREILGAEKKDTLIFEDSLYAAKTAAQAGYRVVGLYDEFSSANKENMQEVCSLYFDDFYKAAEIL